MPGIPLPKRSHEGPATSLGSSFQRSIGRVNVSPPCPSSFAYVTLFSNDAYLPGAIALQRSARAVGLQHPLIVICTQAVSQSSLKALAREGCQLRHVQPFQTPDTVQQSKYVRALYAECWNKLWMWEWEEFSRLVYLDADMVLCRNVDHLFTLPPAALYAVGDCYGGRETQEERSACCHFTPDAQPQYFNAGFYVMTPNKAEFAAMHAALAAGSVEVGRFAEQDFLNGYFNGRWRPLPYIYNAQKRIKYHHPNLWDLQHIAVIHYVDDKPWNNPHSPENMAYQDIVEYWWRVYGQGTEGEAKLLGVGAPGEKDTKDAAQAVGLHAPLGLMSKKSTNAVSLHAPLGLVVLQSCEVEAVQQRAVVAVHGAGAQASEGGLGNRS